MKKKILNLIQRFLQFLARIKISRAKPKIIAISGSFGKTSVKEAIYLMLAKKFGSDVGKNWGNMNSVIGLPLAILGLRKYSFGCGFFWDIIKVEWNFFFYRLPKILVLEMGIDKPGEMAELLKIFSPDIAVITGIAETHLEQLKNIDGVKREKSGLFSSLKKGGVAIFSSDDENSKNLPIKPDVKKLTFGREGDVSFFDFKTAIIGSKFILNLSGEKVEVKTKLLGEFSLSILLAAAAVASEFSIPKEEIIAVMEKIEPQKGRMNPIKAKNQITVIDDSYNSNPRSAIEALKTLSAIDFGERKVAILGNMNELGSYSKPAHFLVGEVAGKSVDLLIVVGENSTYLEQGAKKSALSESMIFSYKNTQEVIINIDSLLKPNDLVLVKASQNGMRFEKIVKHLINNDDLASKVLVRQEKKWQKLL